MNEEDKPDMETEIDEQELEGRRSFRLTAPEKAALAAIAVNVTLTLLKFLLSYYSRSLSLKVEAYHSFADIGSSMAVFIAVRAEMLALARGKKPGGEKSGLLSILSSPQTVVALGIGAFLSVIGVFFLYRVVYPSPMGTIAYPVHVGLGMLFLALLSYLLSRLERIVGERHGCTALVADGFHARVDMVGSLLVAAALLGERIVLSLDPSASGLLDRFAAGALAAFVLLQAANVFGAVIRDLARGEETEDLLYREWLWLAIKNRLPRVTPRVIDLTVKLIGGNPDSPESRKKAGIVASFVLVVLALFLYVASGSFSVGTGEKAIVERFGSPLEPGKPLGPGLHWCWPWPVDKVRKVDVGKVRRLNVGSIIDPKRTTVLWTNDHYIEQFNVLSGENIFIDVGVAIHYRVVDPAKWLYVSSDPEGMISSASYAVLAEEFAHIEFLESITKQRDEIEARFEKKLAEDLKEYDLGVKILSFQIKDAHPPTEVAADFENVVSATIEYETKINEANGYANDLIPRAEGEFETLVNAAAAEAGAGMYRARGDVEIFKRLAEAEAKSPGVMKTRLAIESAERVLPNREKIVVPPEAASGSIELFMTVDPGKSPASAE